MSAENEILFGLEVHHFTGNGSERLEVTAAYDDQVGPLKDFLLGEEEVWAVTKTRLDPETGEREPELDEYGLPIVFENRRRPVPEREARFGHIACEPDPRVFEVLAKAGIDVEVVEPKPSDGQPVV